MIVVNTCSGTGLEKYNKVKNPGRAANEGENVFFEDIGRSLLEGASTNDFV